MILSDDHDSLEVARTPWEAMVCWRNQDCAGRRVDHQAPPRVESAKQLSQLNHLGQTHVVQRPNALEGGIPWHTVEPLLKGLKRVGGALVVGVHAGVLSVLLLDRRRCE